MDPLVFTSSFLRVDFFFFTKRIDGWVYEFLIAVKIDGQVFSIFFKTGFRFSDLKAFLASISKLASMEVLLY